MVVPDYKEITDALEKAGVHIAPALKKQTDRKRGSVVLFPESEKPDPASDWAVAVEFSLVSVVSSVTDRTGTVAAQALAQMRQSLLDNTPDKVGHFSGIEWIGGDVLGEDDGFWYWRDRFQARYENTSVIGDFPAYSETKITDA